MTIASAAGHIASGWVGTSDTQVRTYPGNSLGTYTLRLVNQSGTTQAVTFGVVPGALGTEQPYHAWEYQYPLPPNASYEQTGLVLGKGHTLYAANPGGTGTAISFTLNGVEE